MLRTCASFGIALSLVVAACGGRSIAEDPLPASTTDAGVSADADVGTLDAGDAEPGADADADAISDAAEEITDALIDGAADAALDGGST